MKLLIAHWPIVWAPPYGKNDWQPVPAWILEGWPRDIEGCFEAMLDYPAEFPQIWCLHPTVLNAAPKLIGYENIFYLKNGRITCILEAHSEDWLWQYQLSEIIDDLR